MIWILCDRTSLRGKCLDRVTNASGHGAVDSFSRIIRSPVSEQCNAGSRGRVIRKELKEILSPFLGSGSKLERSPASSTEEIRCLASS